MENITQPVPQPTAYQNYNPYDHTAEYTAKDISENKVFCMLCYLLGPVGAVIALLAASSSPYIAFHVRQSLKLTVVSILLGAVAAVLVWTIFIPILAGLAMLVLYIIQIICFFQVCSGKAIEPPIVRDLPFLR